MLIPEWLTPLALLILITVLLLGILVVLCIIARRSGDTRIVVDQESLDQTLGKIHAAATHTADIAALTQLVEQVKLNPEILLRVDEYGAMTLAAARLHAMKLLEGDLSDAREKLSMRLRSGTYTTTEQHRMTVDRAQAHVDLIEAKLLAVAQPGRTDNPS